MIRFLSLLFLIGLISITPNAFSQSVEDVMQALDSLKEKKQFVVDPHYTHTGYVWMTKGDRIDFTIYVTGGKNNDIGFKVEDPNKNSMFEGGIVSRWDSSITAERDGNHYFIFDNTFSLVSKKNVIFEYVITPAIVNVGGCLIATATYGTEMAPQVQQLREIRDNYILQTESGTAFMSTFNQFYYSFSPYIADYERENPLFKEIVKIGITPMLSTLTLMDYAESETEVLTIGISLIILNGLMYVGIPIFTIMIIRK